MRLRVATSKRSLKIEIRRYGEAARVEQIAGMRDGLTHDYVGADLVLA